MALNSKTSLYGMPAAIQSKYSEDVLKIGTMTSESHKVLNMTNQTNYPETFEAVLISYSEMCYSVAFALTHNPHWAHELTTYVMTWAWHQRNQVDREKDLKKKLLLALRKRFLETTTKFNAVRKEPSFAGRI